MSAQLLNGIYSVQSVTVARWSSPECWTVTWEPNDCDSGLDQEYEDEFDTLEEATARAALLLTLTEDHQHD